MKLKHQMARSGYLAAARVVWRRRGRRGAWLINFSLTVTLLCAAVFSHAENSIILLVATEQLQHSVFEQSVVLVNPQRDGAAVGVILNHPLNIDAADLYPEDPLLQDAGVIRFGGPVAPAALLYLFRSQQAPDQAIHLFEDVYFSSDRELLGRQLQRPQKESRLQFYAGYAGWAPGKLQAEILRGSWLPLKATTKLLFNKDRESIWRELSKAQQDDWI
ncbi:YqgE/AlgH family protein [bacterium]|nr:YqgE/AlgH family protein [bacterium]